jgi:hypothetical protein
MKPTLERVTRKIRMTPFDLVRYQIITELVFFRKEHLILSDIELLSLLGLWGPVELRTFCAGAARALYPEVEIQDMPTREQNVRNRVVKLIRRSLVVKPLKAGRQIALHPNLTAARPLTGPLLLENQLLSLPDEPEQDKHSENTENNNTTHTPQA